MMKPELLAGLACLALGSTAAPAAAQVVDGATTLQATFRGGADPACRLSTPAASGAQNISVEGLSNGTADLTISQLVGEAGASLGATIVLEVPAVCNQAHVITVTSRNGGLTTEGGPVSGPFRASLPYGVTVGWAGQQRTLNTEAGQVSVELPDAATGSVTVVIEVPSGGAPLVAGAYSDELILELGVAG